MTHWPAPCAGDIRLTRGEFHIFPAETFAQTHFACARWLLSSTAMICARLIAMLMATALSGCRPATSSRISGPMTQRGYLWQRDWTQSVAEAFKEAESRVDMVVILGGEIVWEGATPRLIKSSIRWDVVAQTTKPIALALRIAPYGGPFASDDASARFIAATANSLLADATGHGCKVAEFQLDFDCAQKKLAGYRAWLTTLRSTLHPARLSITALPSWLEEGEFAALLGAVDDYVLQVHSVPAHGSDPQATLCDAPLARRATEKAAQLRRRFSVALPTYRCLGGYDAEGKLLGVAMDGVQPSWPRGTRVLEFGSDATELARLIADWKQNRPAVMQGVVWYRLPMDSDLRNWRWPTLRAVMDGREPTHRLDVGTAGENPVDLELINRGEAEERFTGSVTAHWNGAALTAADSVAGWTLRTTQDSAIFTAETGQALRLLPGERRGIGWLRYDRRAQPELVLDPSPR